jgi:tetratricopeptide (TPR) repeat protein
MNKNRFIISALISTLLLGAPSFFAKTDTKTLVEKQTKSGKDNIKKTPKEVIDGVQKSFMALALLKKGKIENAKSLLKEAVADFDKAIKTNPHLAVLPIEQEIAVFELKATSSEIEKSLNLAESLLKKRYTQDARDILMPLRDELDINTRFVPMAIYPLAIKNALSALNRGDSTASVAILTNAFSMIIDQKVIIPLSLLIAQDLVKEASKLDKSKKSEALKLLADAKEELKKAELLGYTTKNSSDYKALVSAIEGIEKEIKGKNMVEKLYKSINKSFDELTHKLKDVSSKESKEAKEKLKEVEKKELKESIKKADEFKKEAVKDLNSTIKK